MCGKLLFLLATVMALATLVAPRAQAATIDFEDFDLGGALYLDVPETLFFSNVGSSAVDVTIIGNTDNRVYDVFKYGGSVSATGQALIDWPWPAGSNPAGTTILFSQPVSQFSLRAGDFGGDDDSPLMIRAYDAGDGLLASDSTPWPGLASPPFATLSLNVSGIRKVVYNSGGTYANSTFIDDLTFVAQCSAIPAPGAFLLGSLGASLVGWLRRRSTL